MGDAALAFISGSKLGRWADARRVGSKVERGIKK
jgi:hypothetical protein